MAAALKSGSLELVKLLLAPPYNFLSKQILLEPDVISYEGLTGARERTAVSSLNMKQAIPVRAAWSGNLELVKLLLAPPHNLRPHRLMLVAACRSGNLKLVEFLRAPPYNFELTYRELVAAARSGNLELVQLVLAAEAELVADWEVLTAAIRSGNLALVQWLVSEERGAQRLAPTLNDLNTAATGGYLPIVKFLVTDQGIEPVTATLVKALEYGCLDILKWLMTEMPVAEGKQRPWFNEALLSKALNAGENGDRVYQQVANWLVSEAPAALRVRTTSRMVWLSLVDQDEVLSVPGLLWLALYAPPDQRVQPDRNMLLRLARMKGELDAFFWLIAEAPPGLRLAADADVLWEALTNEGHPFAKTQTLGLSVPAALQVRPNQEMLARLVQEINSIDAESQPQEANGMADEEMDEEADEEEEEDENQAVGVNAANNANGKRKKLEGALRWLISEAAGELRVRPVPTTVALANDPALRELLNQHVIQPAEVFAPVSSSSTSTDFSAPPLNPAVTSALPMAGFMPAPRSTGVGNGGSQSPVVNSSVGTNSASNTESAGSSSSSSSTPQQSPGGL